MPVSSVADAFLPLLPHEAGETSAALRLLHHVAQRAGTRLPSYLQEDPCPLLVPEEDLYVDYEHDDDGPSDSNSDGELEELRGSQGSPSGTHAREAAAAEALPAVLPRPQTCSYFTPGQTFTGCQKLFGGGPGRARQEDWQVHVTIQSVDMASGCMTGTMEARNVPLTRGPILTFFEGEIIDNGRHTFLTHKWGASVGTDLAHWGKFPAFSSMARQVSRHGGRSSQLGDCPYVFMRWKELFFVNAPQNCSLTIAGFYYVAMSRQDGRITGYYYDPHSAPFQELTLRPAAERGVAFGSYALI